MLPKQNRIRKRREFDTLFKRGRTIPGSLISMRWMANTLPHSRVGIVVSNKISKKATVRNTIKRRLRESIRKILQEKRFSIDLVIIARNPIVAADYAAIYQEVVRLLSKVSQPTYH